MISLLLLCLFLSVVAGQPFDDDAVCSESLLEQCQVCQDDQSSSYDCSLPGMETFAPGQYEGITVNYLSFVTETSSPNMVIRAKEFEACTGGKVLFSEAQNVWEDPVTDLGTCLLYTSPSPRD